MNLPDGARPYRRTASFTQDTIPPALLKAHATKDGVWGLIHVESGQLVYRISDPRRAAASLVLSPEGPPGVIEPTILHEVEPAGPVCFHVAFHRLPDGGQ
jgi:tellurite resistance-related uncharacterized protein